MIDEADLALVHALQVQPRADWTRLAAVLDCTPATAARRWQRLSEAGEAWVTAVPGPRCGAFAAFVGLRCAPGRREEAAAALVGDPAAVTVELTVGSQDLLVEVVTPDLTGFGRYLLDRVERIPGVTGSTVAVATTVVSEASRWRLDALSRRQSTALSGGPGGAGSGRPAARSLAPLDHRLLAELGRDGRRPWDRIAEAAGTSAATARRRSERLLAAGEAALRCDVAAALFDRPVTVFLWSRIPAPQLDTVAAALAETASVRLVAGLAGPHNLLITAWLRSVDDVPALEAALVARHPGLAIDDRTIALRTVKRMGRVLDADGRSIATVPTGPWADQRPRYSE